MASLPTLAHTIPGHGEVTSMVSSTPWGTYPLVVAYSHADVQYWCRSRQGK